MSSLPEVTGSRRHADAVRFRDRFAFATFPDGGVAIDLERGFFFALDARGARICELLASRGGEELAAKAMRGDDPPEPSEQGVRALLDALECEPAPTGFVPPYAIDWQTG